MQYSNPAKLNKDMNFCKCKTATIKNPPLKVKVKT